MGSNIGTSVASPLRVPTVLEALESLYFIFFSHAPSNINYSIYPSGTPNLIVFFKLFLTPPSP